MDYDAITGLGTLLLATAAIITIIYDQFKHLRKANNLRSQIMFHLHQLIILVENEINLLEKISPPEPSDDKLFPKLQRKLPNLAKYNLAITMLFTQGYLLSSIENNMMLSILIIIHDLEVQGCALQPYYQLCKFKELHTWLVNYSKLFGLTDIPPTLATFLKNLILNAGKKEKR